MVRVIFCGCFGRMGNAVREIIRDNADMGIVAGVDITEGTADFPVYNNITEGCWNDCFQHLFSLS